MKSITSILLTLILLSTHGTYAQAKLSINDIFIGLMDSSYRFYVIRDDKGEVFHIRDRYLAFLYDDKPVVDSSVKFIIVNNIDSIKNYFSKEDFKYKREKHVVDFSLSGIFSDTIFIDVTKLLVSTEYFNKKRRAFIGINGRTKLYAFYDRKLNKWVVNRLDKCSKCPDK
jgi:hypothetical protein